MYTYPSQNSKGITKCSIGIDSAGQRDCFERITEAISTVVCRKKQLSIYTCACDSEIVKNMKHHVKTAQGVTDLVYESIAGKTLIVGGIQGRGNIMAE